MCAKLCVAGWLCMWEPSGGMFLCVGYWRVCIRIGTICTKPCLRVFPPTNCATHQFHSNECIPLQAAFFPSFVWPHCPASSYSPFKAPCIICVGPLISSCRYIISSAATALCAQSEQSSTHMLLVHLSCVFEARDCIRSQVYVYISIRRLLMRVFQDVN